MSWRLTVVTLVIFLGLGSHSLAAEKSISSKGISISPAIVNLGIDQNLPTTSFKIKVSNNLAQRVHLDITSLDFKSLNETGGVAFIGNGSGKYGLANWLQTPKEGVDLEPHSSQAVEVTIANRADLSPGGHYAAVLFKNNGSSASGANRVEVNQVIAALVFLKKSGGEIYSLQASKPDFGTSWLKLPNTVNLLIKNTGNTQTEPRGTIVITDPSGREIRRGVINPDSALVLPDSTRLFRTELFKVSHPYLPGHYTATISYRSADSRQATTVSYDFFYLSLPSLLFFLALLGAVVTLIRGKSHKSYPHKIILK